MIGQLRSLEMAPFDRSHTSSYLSCITNVSIFYRCWDISVEIGLDWIGSNIGVSLKFGPGSFKVI